MFDGLLIKIEIHAIEDREKRYMANQETTSNTPERMSANIIAIAQTK
jgi:hypothetical protein